MAPESRRVLDLAREEMLNLKHWWIGTEHVLWGLASEESLPPLPGRGRHRFKQRTPVRHLHL